MNNSTTFYLNGEKYKLVKTITLFELIYYFDYDKEIFIIEYNNLICNLQNWKEITLKKNDKIEILTIVGGG